MDRKSARVAALALGLALAKQLAVAAPTLSHDIQFVRELTTGGQQALSLPSDVAVDNRQVYVVDGGNHRVVVFDRNGKYRFAIGEKGSGAGQFLDPVGITAGVDDRIHVADTGNHRVQTFDADGKYIDSFQILREDKPIRPIDVAESADGGELYVTGNNNHKVMVFSPDGRFLREWGGGGLNPGEFRYPGTIVLLRDARIAVVDILNTRVQVFERSGNFSIEIGQWGVLPGNLFRPKGVAIDSAGRLYVSDSYMNLVEVYSDTGQFLYVLRMPGAPHRIETPTGLAVDDDNHLYIAEMSENRVSVFNLGE